jgi:hypothetical protein
VIKIIGGSRAVEVRRDRVLSEKKIRDVLYEKTVTKGKPER